MQMNVAEENTDLDMNYTKGRHLTRCLPLVNLSRYRISVMPGHWIWKQQDDVAACCYNQIWQLVLLGYTLLTA
ncbi:MAG TPA: hypothetical protein GX404_09770 [Syntrophomonadaceae bacterium]|nr:hypothetical protein [Syntrophomonadaceae bacterium]